MGIYAILAEALRYPAPGRIENLQAAEIQMPDGDHKKKFHAFLVGVGDLTLGEWEELHTRTLDLNPPAAPYLGYQMWGDSYQRGQFMASLNKIYQAEEIDLDGELPDHLIPILRYLDSVSDPTPELVEILEPAVRRMRDGLRKSEANNPYDHLLSAILTAISTAQLNSPVADDALKLQAF